jgi:hypothetical protein
VLLDLGGIGNIKPDLEGRSVSTFDTQVQVKRCPGGVYRQVRANAERGKAAVSASVKSLFASKFVKVCVLVSGAMLQHQSNLNSQYQDISVSSMCELI